MLQLLDSHGPRLHGLLFRLTLRQDVAEDLLQDLAVRLLDSSGFTGARDPLAYACQTAIHLAMDWRRRRKRQNVFTETLADLPDPTASPLAQAAGTEELDRLLDQVSQLPPVARQALTLRFLEQKSYEEMAAMMGRSPHHVRALCHKALRQLRKGLTARTATARDAIAFRAEVTHDNL